MPLPLLLLFVGESIAIESIVQSGSKILGGSTVPDPATGDLFPGEFAVWWYSIDGIEGPIILEAPNEVAARELWFETSPTLQIANVIGKAITTPGPDPVIGDRPQARVFANNVAHKPNQTIKSKSSLKIAIVIGLIFGTFIAMRGK